MAAASRTTPPVDNPRLDSNSSAEPPYDQKPTSRRKAESNRRNALRSTGPRTVPGKIISSRNATKHGFLSDQIVNEELGEKLEDFQTLHEELIEDFKPVGRTEHLLVEQIATCFFRLRRVNRAESAELSKSVLATKAQPPSFPDDDGVGGRTFTLPDDVRIEASEYVEVLKTVKTIAKMRIARQTLAGIRELKFLFLGYRDRIEKEGLTPALQKALLDLLLPILPAGFDEGAFPEPELRKMAWDTLDKEIRELDRLEANKVQNKKHAMESNLRSHNVMPEAVMERVLRYETHLARQLDKTMLQLDRLQKRRLGEWVPPPLSLQIEPA